MSGTESAIKHSNLKGEFKCSYCYKIFRQSASLTRHSVIFHGEDYVCLICNKSIDAKDNVRAHMKTHEIFSACTCGCCNWIFRDKKDLKLHNSYMRNTGQPGDTKAIAIGSHPSGSRLQRNAHAEEEQPVAISSKTTTVVSPKNAIMPTKVNPVTLAFNPLNNTATKLENGPISSLVLPKTQDLVEWISLLLSNPVLLRFLKQQSADSTEQGIMSLSPIEDHLELETSSSFTNFVRASADVSSNAFIHLRSEFTDDDHIIASKAFARSLLISHTDSPKSSISDSFDSGIGSSSEYDRTPSPPLTIWQSREGTTYESGDAKYLPAASPSDIDNSNVCRKRKSIDEIASALREKQFIMG